VLKQRVIRDDAPDGLAIALRACRNIGAQSVVGTVDQVCAIASV
jgi:hypothetical protein